MTASHRSFADDVRSRTPQQLRDLVILRPDLLHPQPKNVSALAARAATRSSVQRAVEGLSADLLHVLEAALVAGGESDGIAALLGVPADESQPFVEQLWTRALLWRKNTAWLAARPVADVLPYPARLGPPWSSFTHLPIPDDLEGRFSGLSDEALRVLDHLTHRHPVGVTAQGVAAASVAELLDAGLVFHTDADRVVLPREVALARRGGVLGGAPLSSPQVGRAGADQHQSDAAAGQAALDLLWQVETLAGFWQNDPPRVMTKGGVSVRDHKRLASALGTSPEHAAFVAELAHAAALVAPDAQISPVWLPTAAYDEWFDLPPAKRWAALAEAWWAMLRAPSLAGGHDSTGAVINLLGPGSAWPLMRQRRHDVLNVLEQLDPSVAAGVDEVEQLLRWHRPLRLPAGAPTQAQVVLQEAEWLGLTSGGHLSTAGRLLTVGALDTSALEEVMPSTVDHVLVQADLTAIAPGPLDDDLRRLMDAIADVESRGGATVFRLTPDSLRRGLEAGLTPDEVRGRLNAASRTPLPQALSYLIDDLARRHGTTRVGSAGSYIRSDDETGLAALAADPAMAFLQLMQIAPTVLVSRLPAARVLTFLRDAGYGALAEDASGALVSASGEPTRAPVPRTPAPVTSTSVDAVAAEALIERLMAAEGTESPSSSDESDPAVSLDLLMDAAASGVPVRIGYVDSSGNLRRTVIQPQQVDGGRVTGLVGSDVRTFSVHRITGVAAV